MTRTSAAPFPRLVADIGGTNARFGWIAQEGAPIERVQVLPCADHPTLADAVRQYLATQQLGAPGSMAMGIATPVVDDQVRMTNHHWAFSQRALREELALERLLVLNDFTTLALALPSLPAGQLRQLGGDAVRDDAPKALIGPGTGLGVSGLLPSPTGWIAIAGEGGHVTLAAQDDREEAVIHQLRVRHGHVSAERAVCGSGLVALYEAICQVDGREVETLMPSDVTSRGLAGSDPACVEALQHFCALLGCVAGNLALTLGARGGVYIGGGIVPRLGEFVTRSRLRERFEEKGRFREYLRPIPLLIIDASVSPALEGAARALAQSTGA
jgi:glucokinase